MFEDVNRSQDFQLPSHHGRGQYYRRGGSHRGRGGHREWGAVTQTRDITEGLLPNSIQMLERPMLLEGEADVTIADVQYLASYNYTNVDEPTMIVPGSPPIWMAPSLPVTVQPVDGVMYNDVASVKVPDYPLLPLFEAVDFMQGAGSQSNLQWSCVDIIADRNNLLKLAGWADEGCLGPHSKLNFRIDLQLVGQRTVVFQRWEPQIDRWGGGYSETFEEACCHHARNFGVSVQPGANRIISYDYSGLMLVVQCDADAYHEIMDNTSTSPTDPSVDVLSHELGSLSVSAAPMVARSQYSANLTILAGGSIVPQASLVKIKTRSATNPTEFPSVVEYLQLLFGQTPTLYVGFHYRGTFEDIKPITLDALESHFAAQAKPGLQKLRMVLEVIRDIAVQRGQGANLSLVCQDGTLHFMERQANKSLLPDGILARFHN